MNRKAILIGASPAAEPLQFVTADVAQWGEFLQSNEGGAWNESEILDASHLDRAKLLNELARMNSSDYSLIVFVGHGFTTTTDLPWTELRLILESGETVQERELNPGSPRCSIVLDCCRTRGENLETIMEHRKTASLKEAYAAVRSRQAYDTAAVQAEMGAVTVYATGDNTEAIDKGSFSQHLIRSATNWAQTNLGILTIKDAVRNGAEELAKRHPQQRPEYNGGRRLRHYPFAVSV
jgi:hypothetical protein